MSEGFKTGDLVELKSGSPVMTVGTIDSKTAWCQWFAGAKHEKAQFLKEMLKKSEPREKEGGK